MPHSSDSVSQLNVSLAFDPARPVASLQPWLQRRGLDDLDLAVHEDDEMLHYSFLQNEGDFDAGVSTYFLSGAEVFATLRQIVGWRWGGFEGVERLLDFGGGFGRLTRFLLTEVEPERLWTAELQPAATAFQREHFGVHVVASSARPEQLETEGRFDFIWVGSLFTHLPEGAFGEWLGRLLELLSPGGVLAFSVHDASLVPPGHRLDDRGMLFLAESESDRLDPEQYGSTWVSQEYVDRALTAASARLDRSVRRFPRAVCRHQDLYVVSTSPRHPASELELDPGPMGLLEHCTIPQPGTLEVSGWAAYPGGRFAVDEVAVRLDGQVLDRSNRLEERPDLVRILETESVRRSGFAFRCSIPVPLERGGAIVEVTVCSSSGCEVVLFLGTLERALYETARNNWVGKRREVRALERHIEWMESSRFWRLRRRWFSLKRVLGLTDEE